MKYWRNLGIRLLPYLDDFMFMSTSREEALQLSNGILWDFRDVGFVVNMEKSMLHLSQSIEEQGESPFIGTNDKGESTFEILYRKGTEND